MNKHVSDYLNYYVSLKYAPEYAILIKGNWGAGKTWFIKNFINQNKKKQFLYVSLYGVSSFQEIENMFFQQLHPNLSSKGVKLAGKIMNGLLKTTIRVDLIGDKDKETSINSSIPKIDLPEYLKKADKKILVFDDLERCSIPIPSLLGYINQFVEHNEQKVILVANEEEIIKSFDKENGKNQYLLIREKLIGKAFTTYSNVEKAYDVFLIGLEDKKRRNLLNKHKELIIRTYSSSKFNNLRHLKQSILDFERFSKFLPEKSFEKPKLVDHIIELFFAISIELKNGQLILDDIPKIFSADYHPIEKDSKITIAKKYRTKYPIFGSLYPPIDWIPLANFFKFGNCSKEELESSINNSIYFKDENTPNWQKLWYFFDLEDDDFDRIYKEVYEKFTSFTIENALIIIHIAGILIDLSKTQLIQLSPKEIDVIAKKNITSLRKKGKLPHEEITAFSKEVSFGLKYRSLKDSNFINLLNFLSDSVKKTKEDSYESLAQELLNQFKESISHLRNALFLTNVPVETHFHDFPILKYMNAEEFVEIAMNLSNKEKRELSQIMLERYKVDFLRDKLQEEKIWLDKVCDILADKLKNNQNKLSSFILKNIMLKTLENITIQLSPIK